ncbi:MAG: hypothetical protein RRB13_06070 [bacterium]|nr:hypothetical protein [bacterium]
MRWLLILFSLLLVWGCGKKTPPVPYGDIGGLPALQEIQVRFVGGQLKLDWARPMPADSEEAFPVEVYRIHFLQAEPGCTACRPEMEGKISIFPDGKVLLQGEPSDLKAQIDPKGNYSLLLPLQALPQAALLHLNLDYRTPEGRVSEASPLKPLFRPGPLPPPNILEARWEAAACGEDCPKMGLLHLRWRPDLARRLDHLDPEGGLYHTEEHYGLALFRLEEGRELPAQKEILLTGAAYLELPKEQLLARQVDRFGNLSSAVEINP